MTRHSSEHYGSLPESRNTIVFVRGAHVSGCNMVPAFHCFPKAKNTKRPICITFTKKRTGAERESEKERKTQKALKAEQTKGRKRQQRASIRQLRIVVNATHYPPEIQVLRTDLGTVNRLLG